MGMVEAEAQESARHDEKALDDWQIAAFGPCYGPIIKAFDTAIGDIKEGG
jgi:hypothetical protein